MRKSNNTPLKTPFVVNNRRQSIHKNDICMPFVAVPETYMS